MRATRALTRCALGAARNTNGWRDVLPATPGGRLVAAALEQRGFVVPTEAQRLAGPVVNRGSDAVVLAQTGTGKTLAYLAPLAARELDVRAARALATVNEAAAASASHDDDRDVHEALPVSTRAHVQSPQPRHRQGPSAVVVVPSHDLAVQVASVYNSLTVGFTSQLTAALVTGASTLEVGPTTAVLIGELAPQLYACLPHVC